MFDDFFAGTGGGAPSFKFNQIGDRVWGTIVDLRKSGVTKYEDGKPDIDETTGQQKQQIEITLQTDLRGWAGVSKVPTGPGPDGVERPLSPEQDKGLRRVFVKEGTNLQYELGKALLEAGGGTQRAPLDKGAMLAVTFSSTRDTGKRDPAKQFQVHFKPASPADTFFQEAPQQAPQPTPTPAAPPAAPPPGFQQPPAAPPQGYPQQAPQGYPQQAPQGYPQQAPAAPPAPPQGYPQQAPQQPQLAPYQGQPPAYPQQPPAAPQGGTPQPDPWAVPTQGGEPPF